MEKEIIIDEPKSDVNGMTVEEAYELICQDVKAIYGIKDAL